MMNFFQIPCRGFASLTLAKEEAQRLLENLDVDRCPTKWRPLKSLKQPLLHTTGRRHLTAGKQSFRFSCRHLPTLGAPLVLRLPQHPDLSASGAHQGLGDKSRRLSPSGRSRVGAGAAAAEGGERRLRLSHQGAGLPLLVHRGRRADLFRQDGRRRGDALIELESKADVQRALEKHLRYMGPRYVKVFEVHDRDVEGLLQSLRDESQAINDGVVLLRGLPFSSTEDDISDFFAGLSITDIAFVNRGDRRTGEAYVQFAAPEMAAKALLRHREYIGNRYIEVYISRKHQMQRHVINHKQMLTYPRVGKEHESVFEERGLSGAGGSRARSENKPYSEVTERSGPVSEPGNTSLSQHFVHVRGFPTQASAQDIINFFAPLKPTRVMVEYNSHGEATGEADVQFESHEEAVAAMAKEGSPMQCSSIELFLKAQPKVKQDC
ncbi:G-rich sequence factor 1 isoform X2 [Struthio camelus]|uniref:G-rich sequence factor 1 isoform X2 n=1 Tax=Struthio camelus TaxID=8801 RepID=UPI0036042ABB